MKKSYPPKFFLRFFRWFCHPKLRNHIEGDLMELYEERVKEKQKADLKFIIDVLLLFRPGIIGPTEGYKKLNTYGMIRNYLKVSMRGLMKNPLNSFINIFGLSVAIGICLCTYSYLAYERNIDQFHKNKNEVYLATFFADREGSTQQYGTTPRPLGEMLRNDFAQIKRVCRVEDRNAVMKYQDNTFQERVRCADAEFLEVFTFPLKWGSANSLSDLNSIILSEEMSTKYFGEENPVGRDILMIFGDSIKKAFKVTGVASAFPKAHAIEFNFLINFENTRIANPNYSLHDWSQFLVATLIQIENASDLKTIEQGMGKYKILQNEAQKDWPISSFSFESLATLHEKSGNINDDISLNPSPERQMGLSIISIFMLALACFNYINIAIVSAAKRAKEIGVRKVIGANSTRVIIQFLSENMVTTFFALIVGFFLFTTVFLPWLVQFTGWPLELKVLDRALWVFLFLLLLFTGIASGLYPAFYISRFEAVRIFKGSLQFGRKNPLTKILLGIQLVLACITITVGVVFTQNNTYQNNRSWGYHQRGALYVRLPDYAAFNKLNAAMVQNPNVQMISGSTDHLGKNFSTVVVHMPPNLKYHVNQLAVSENYFETMELQLKEGRIFREHSKSDKQAIVVNELFVKNLNLTEPIGQQIEIDSIKYEVIGVLKEFHMDNFFNKIKPTVFKVAEEQDYRFLTLRVKSGSEIKTNQALQQQWAKLYPEIPFQGGHQEDVWGNYFVRVDRSETFSKVIASIAVLLASLGLYGLVTLNVLGRVKEFSIRKVLGAGFTNMTSIIIKQYAVLTTLALMIGAPISYYISKAYLDALFSYSMPMGYSGVAIAVLILVAVLSVVVLTQIVKVSKSNPVEGLKAE